MYGINNTNQIKRDCTLSNGGIQFAWGNVGIGQNDEGTFYFSKRKRKGTCQISVGSRKQGNKPRSKYSERNPRLSQTIHAQGN